MAHSSSSNGPDEVRLRDASPEELSMNVDEMTACLKWLERPRIDRADQNQGKHASALTENTTGANATWQGTHAGCQPRPDRAQASARLLLAPPRRPVNAPACPMPQHPLFRLPRAPFAAETRTLTLATTAALAVALSQGAAWAQQASNAEPASAHASTASAPPRELGKPEEDLQLDVIAYQVDSLPGVPAAELAAITAPFVGKARGYEDLSNAVAAVTLYMQRRLGYYVGMAYLPEQQAKGGVVHIAVLEGRLDEVKVNWPEALPVQREVIGRYLARLQPGSVLRVNEVERVVFLVNDLPGIRTRFEIEPGRAPGTATLVVTPQAEPRVSSRAELDTLGSHNTGISRLGVQSSVASPSGLGDSLQLHVRSSTSAKLYDGGLNYSVPVGAQGLKLGASINRVNYKLPNAIFTLDMRGSATATSVFGLYPWVRSRSLNVFGLASYEHKRFVDRLDAFSTSKSSNDLQVGTLGDWRSTPLMRPGCKAT
jgi:hemolysin activation/secretion protein